MCVRFLEKKSITEVYNVIIVMTMRLFDTHKFWKKKCYGCLRFNVISFTREAGGVIFPGEKRYVTLEWPPYTLPG